MIKHLSICLLSVLAIFLTACFSGNGTFESFPQTEYHTDEIIDTLYEDIYGEWTLYAVSGGFVGIWEDYSPRYYLTVKPYGIYGYYDRSTLKEYGKLTVHRQDSLMLVLNLEPDPDSPDNIYYDDMTVYVHLEGQDTLGLNFYGCDGFNYHYVRK